MQRNIYYEKNTKYNHIERNLKDTEEGKKFKRNINKVEKKKKVRKEKKSKMKKIRSP